MAIPAARALPVIVVRRMVSMMAEVVSLRDILIEYAIALFI